MFNDFAGIPEVFVNRYEKWFIIWAKNAGRWGRTCYFPLVPFQGRPVLIDIPRLDEHGQTPFIVVSLTAQELGNRVTVRPTTRHDADLIKRHSATLLQ